MKYRCLITILALILMFIPGQTAAEMSSTNYRIPTTVVSGGGGPMGSASFQTNGTLGQPSPLPDPADPPFSDSYDLYPGFWYTLVRPKCECDLNKDGNCNGLDWLLFYPDWGRTDCNDPGAEPCECDLNGNGRCEGLDWLSFYPDWGRTDCPIP